MKPSANPKNSNSKLKLSLIVASMIIVVAIVAYVGLNAIDHNYAKEDAQPLISALQSKGAKVLCGREDNGRGPDNKAPWYYTLLEVDSSREQATNSVLDTMKANGFNNFVGSAAPATPNDVNTFTDKTSQKSSRSDLKEGNVGLTVEALLNSTYSSANQFCGVTKSEHAPSDRTIIRITLGLPEYK